MRPSLITAMRSESTSASSWSCVTKSAVRPEPPLQPLHLELHLLAQLAVERAERLVEEQQTRIEDDRSRERDALLLAAGELARGSRAARSAEADELQDRRDALANLRPRHAAHFERERDVALDRQVREQRVVLEHHADPALRGRGERDVVALQPHACPRREARNPAMILSSVVLPEPLGPRIVTSSPGWTVRSTPASATTSPNRRTMPLRLRDRRRAQPHSDAAFRQHAQSASARSASPASSLAQRSFTLGAFSDCHSTLVQNCLGRYAGLVGRYGASFGSVYLIASRLRPG